jgi:hypothetical protein
MPFGGDFTPRSPGELRTFSFDFAKDLATGDAIASATTTLSAYSGTDANAATLLNGSPQLLAGKGGAVTVVAQQIGTNAGNTNGFLPSVNYRWTINATSVNGEKLVWFIHIPINPPT